MGKGIIISKINEEGLYMIDYMYNLEELSKELARIEARILALNEVELPRAEENRVAAWDVYNIALANLNQAIAEHADKETIETLTQARLSASEGVDEAKYFIYLLTAELISAENSRDSAGLEAVTSKSVSAWCADYNIDLAIGLEVGVMEFPGEGPGVAGHPHPEGISRLFPAP